MATIKAIEARSIHQIQSGQVIVDLCSVVKELVENSLDAGATLVEVRFRNNGLESIEVQDNGSGISPENYGSVALKHYTSKLSSYDDLSSLQTFGFRGEALSSLCALSSFHIVTARAEDAPKARRLDFEISGRMKSSTIVAGQKGTTAIVEGLFQSLPVRRRELEKNIKREYGKVLGLLHAYACISVDVKFTVKNQMPKGKSATVFATKSNPTTRENIANVYGAKTLSALIPLDLSLNFESTSVSRLPSTVDDGHTNKILVHGHISRPVFGEGRQTPDRQMFFVNSRPCGLPQIAKAFNEVYRSFNVSQSPFIFADLQMDTNAYDVNVSPDKRTIMLHDAAALIESLKSSLMAMFEDQDQTVPQSQLYTPKLPAFKQLTIPRETSAGSNDSAAIRALSHSQDNSDTGDSSDGEDEAEGVDQPTKSILHDFFKDQVNTREERTDELPKSDSSLYRKKKLARALGEAKMTLFTQDDNDHAQDVDQADADTAERRYSDIAVRDFNARMAEQQQRGSLEDISYASPSTDREESIPRVETMTAPEQPNIIQNALDRMRPKRTAQDVATITIGDKTVTTVVGSQRPKEPKLGIEDSPQYKRKKSIKSRSDQSFRRGILAFAAPGTQQTMEESITDEEEVDDEDNEEGESTQEASGSSNDDVESVEVGEDSESARDGEYNDEARDFMDPVQTGNREILDDVIRVENDMEDDVEEEVDEKEMSNGDSDAEYLDDAEKKAREEAKVAELIRAAEEQAARPTRDNIKRAAKALKGGNHRDSTTSLQLTMDGTFERIEDQLVLLQRNLREYAQGFIEPETSEGAAEPESEEERLSLTVSKRDFAQMRITGQFNLGFILATRPSTTSGDGPGTALADQLFIIDQHASDEKYNFERLQNETTVGNQRLVQPKPLDLTALEEEIIIENLPSLERNGFIVTVDDSGDEPIGRRCRLVSLPLSKEVVFDMRDLEELIHLLAETPTTLGSDPAPARPSKVRKMFAMRACRSSVMIGKTLSAKQMGRIIEHMGEIDKPWNCPHGRPTMRHLMSLNAFESWEEGQGVAGLGESEEVGDMAAWKQYSSDHIQP